jgi:uncharacterized cupin superfamily protein
MSDDVAYATLDPDTVEDRFRSLRRALGVESFGINHIVLAPRQQMRVHRHEHQEEVYLVLAGTLTLVFEDGEQALGAGELARVGPATRRQLVNRGPQPLSLLALGGAGEHVARDGVAYDSWDSTEGKEPRDVPLPPDLTDG